MIFSINITIDPANIISGVELNIAKYLVEGLNVKNIPNVDERMLQKHVILNLKKCPKTIILGSSRIMLVGENFYDTNSLNNGVSGASIEDLIAIYQLYIQKGCSLDKVVIGVDPWLFNENNGQSRWTSLKNEYNGFSKTNNRNLFENLSFFKYSQLLSISYFQASLKKLYQNIKSEKTNIEPTKNKINSTFTRLIDGTISYDLQYRTVTAKDLDNRIKSYITGDLYSIEKYNNLSKDKILEFESFIKKIKEQNIAIEFLLMPYPSIVYDYIESNHKYINVIKTEEYIKKYSRDNNIIVKGSYDPKMFKLNANDFYDGMHLTPCGIAKVLDSK